MTPDSSALHDARRVVSSWKGLLRHVAEGRKVLFGCGSSKVRRDWFGLLEATARDNMFMHRMHFNRTQNRVYAPYTGGLIHLVVEDIEALGHEYHQGIGDVPPRLQPYIRLKMEYGG